MKHRNQGLLDQFSAVYLLASVGMALGFLFVALSKGNDLIGAPNWAWIFWSIGLLLAINITHMVGERRHAKVILAMGCIPLLLFAIVGAMDTTAGTDLVGSAMLRDLFVLSWVFALVISPLLLLAVACACWYERFQAVVARKPE